MAGGASGPPRDPEQRANGAGLVRYLGEQGSMAKLRPDQKLVFIRDWPTGIDRLKGAATILTRLVRLAEADKAVA